MTAPPGKLADRPPTVEDVALDPGPDGATQAHDLLSELLRSVRLSGDRIVAHAPPRSFSMDFADMGSLLIIEEGELTLRIEGDPQVRQLSRGDFALLPRGDRHRISDAAEHDAAEPARWLRGTFAIGDPRASHLLGSLPAVIVLRGADRSAADALEGLAIARRMLVFEMRAPSQGSAVMVARILDLIFIQLMRAWAAGADVEPNWLAGAFDPQIGLALSAMHRDPCRDWTVEDLARACNLSRSAFAARFVDRVGKPPATYLAHVRLDAATRLLRDSLLPITLVAENVGYTSEAAFSRAFKNRYGLPPARWRRDVQGR
ncbi:MAG: cupin domain-containing protein [Catenulispora sp.]